MTDADAELAETLARLLAMVGGRSWRVEDLHRLSAGASRETWSFDAVATDGTVDRRPLILQRTRPGLAMGGPSLGTEDALLRAAAEAGVPVPAVVVDAEATTPAVGPGRVTERIDGETLGSRLVSDDRFAEARSVLAGQCGAALAGIHRLDPAAFADLEPVDTLGRLRDGLDLLDEARPCFELALRWLHANRPEPGRLSVVHGDFRIGNLVVDETGLRAVLDWELAHLGDPLEDLGWLCVRAWRFGGAGEVGGIAPLAHLLDAYADATGQPVDPEAVRWWIVAGTLTWGLICAVQARRHLDGHVASVELAAIGRRVCETEYDLLGLIGVGDAETDQSPTVAAEPASIHGRPTAAELIDAVRGHLRDVIAPEAVGAQAYGLRVAINALGMVERELMLGSTIERSAADRLAALGFADEPDLAASLRRGDRAEEAEVRGAVRALIVDRVRVANPRWLHPADRPAPTD